LEARVSFLIAKLAVLEKRLEDAEPCFLNENEQADFQVNFFNDRADADPLADILKENQ
jgi:hypothetical protein